MREDSKRVLIIEDELRIAELERDYLASSGYGVDICTNGEEGLSQALDEDYDSIILDLMLPGMDGFEICEKIRAQKNVPVIIVSAKEDDLDKIRGLGLGADDYLTKPFSPNELVARVKAHMARYERLMKASQKQNEVICVRGLKIDRTSRKVWNNGTEILTTEKEFDLLVFLAANPGRVFSKQDLYREIWKQDPIGEELATVTVYIKKLREKLDEKRPGSKYIETIWGVGYRFKGN